MLDKLIPVSGENSLRQVVATVYAHSPLIEPKRFEGCRDVLNYQKFELLYLRTINLSFNKEMNLNQTPKENGFRIINYKDGRINKLISVQQKTNNNKDTTQFSYHSLKYPKWELFKEDLLKDFNVISQVDNPFINAISLNYVNEFLWNSDEDIVVEEIFDKTADFLPKFSNSQNSSFLINTEEDGNYKYKSIERLEVVVSKTGKTIITNSQVVFELKRQIKFNNSISEGELNDMLEQIHKEIKETLRKLFTEEVKQKINLI